MSTRLPGLQRARLMWRVRSGMAELLLENVSHEVVLHRKRLLVVISHRGRPTRLDSTRNLAAVDSDLFKSDVLNVAVEIHRHEDVRELAIAHANVVDGIVA